jgi:beta-glucosidase
MTSGLRRASARRVALADFAGAPEVVALSYADGPNGIRGAAGATMFPSTLAVAASADRLLAREYGRMLATELTASGHNVLLGPGLDIARDPRAGRLGESMGEDPLLVGELAGEVIRGVHGGGALCVLKHLVGNNVERLRTGSGSFLRRTDAVDVRIDGATLHEVYLAPFRRAVVRHGALGLMTSYNRLNGEYPGQSAALLDVPRRLWGFTGFTVPDFLFAVRDPSAALRAGLDLPGLDGSAGRLETHLDEAGDEVVDRIVDHVVGAARQVGLRPPGVPVADGLGAAAALALAERILIEGAVLLRNDGVLPLAPRATIALIGADPAPLLTIGGSAAVTPTPERIVPVAAALRGAGYDVIQSTGSLGDVPLPVVAAGSTVGGIRARVIDELTGDAVELDLATACIPARPDGIGDEWRAELSMLFRLPCDGLHRFAVDAAGESELLIDGRVAVRGAREASPMIAGPRYPLQATHTGQAGDVVELTVRYRTGAALVIEQFGLVPHVELGHDAASDRIRAAASTAGSADAVLVLAGRVSGETMDVDDLRLPGDQEHLVEAVAAANARTIVVTASANPVVAPWRNSVAAWLHVWQPGERFGPALAAMVSGAAEPGGRLPLSFPPTTESIPITPHDDDRVLEYREQSAVGYRGYEVTGREPAFWFGHGRGYAEITMVLLGVADGAAHIRLTCSADRGGKAVVQLYGRVPDAETAVLCGWQVERLAAGESRDVSVPIDLEALARWDADAEQLVVPAGIGELMLGASRGEIVGTAPLPLTRTVVAVPPGTEG